VKIEWIETDKLAASGIPIGEKDLRSLFKQGIRAIITLTEHPLTIQAEISPAVLGEISLTYLHAPILDQYPPNSEIIWETIQFINQMREQHQPTLIHCHAGVGRTGTVLHAYYLTEGLTLEETKAKVKKLKPSSQFLMLSDEQKAFLETFARELKVKTSLDRRTSYGRRGHR